MLRIFKLLVKVNDMLKNKKDKKDCLKLNLLFNNLERSHVPSDTHLFHTLFTKHLND